MSEPPITEASLRAAMRDPRYWQSGHPERTDYVARVSEGWRKLVEAGPGQSGAVNVRSYVRTVNGKAVNVSAHTRADPPGGSGIGGEHGIEDGKTSDRTVTAAY